MSPNILQQLEASKKEITTLQSRVRALTEQLNSSPVRSVVQLTDLAAAAASPMSKSVVISPPTNGSAATPSTLGSIMTSVIPMKPLSDAPEVVEPAPLTIVDVIMEEVKVEDCIENRDSVTKQLNGVKLKIRNWVADFETREGRKAEKADKRAIRQDFLDLRDLEQKVAVGSIES